MCLYLARATILLPVGFLPVSRGISFIQVHRFEKFETPRPDLTGSKPSGVTRPFITETIIYHVVPFLRTTVDRFLHPSLRIPSFRSPRCCIHTRTHTQTPSFDRIGFLPTRRPFPDRMRRRDDGDAFFAAPRFFSFPREQSEAGSSLVSREGSRRWSSSRRSSTARCSARR